MHDTTRVPRSVIWRPIGFLLWLPVTVLGCGDSGPEMVPISGTVTFNGDDVAEGYVKFVPKNPAIAPDAGPIQDGQFAFDVKPGPKRVEIEATRFTGPDNPIMGLRPKEQYLPEKYNTESALEVEVRPDGDNEFPFELTSDDE